MIVARVPALIRASLFSQFSVDALSCLVEQRPEEVVAGRKRIVRSRNVDEYFRIGSVVVEGHYQFGGMVSQKVLGSVHVVGVLLVESRPPLPVIISAVGHNITPGQVSDEMVPADALPG